MLLIEMVNGRVTTDCTVLDRLASRWTSVPCLDVRSRDDVSSSDIEPSLYVKAS